MHHRQLTMFVLTGSFLGGCVAQLPGNLDAGESDSTGTGDHSEAASGDGDGDGDPGDGDGDPGDGDGDPSGDGDGSPPDLEGGQDTDTDDPDRPCGPLGTCNQIDLLFVIDNSGTMGEEQINLSANLPGLLDALMGMVDDQGQPLEPDINIMFTTTDVGHPQCTPFQPDNYTPANGAPRSDACIDRLDDFEGLGSNAPEIPEACTNICPVSIEPIDPFIHFEGPDAAVTNIPGNDIAAAMQCLAPQGINGCGYESPLEAMIQAINPVAAWNQGDKPFVRDGATLAIVLITDEEDCSVRGPEGHEYFTNQMLNTYWEVNPETGTKTQATSAVCWNAGTECTGLDPNGVYEECHAVDNEVLHPLSRYSSYLKTELIDMGAKEVVMLGILGVPASGVENLVYRKWKDSDILPTEDDDVIASTKQFEFGIGPGCTGTDGMGGFTGQAISPVRIKEICQGLDGDDHVRCCVESICASDFSPAFECLADAIQEAALPAD